LDHTQIPLIYHKYTLQGVKWEYSEQTRFVLFH
jgi:hypothetical protein